MKKQIITLALAICSGSLLFFSCKKDDDNDHATPVPPTFVVTSPGINQNYQMNDPIKIQVDIKSETQMHGYKMAILKQNGDTVYFKEDAKHGIQLSINETWVNTLTDYNELKLRIAVITDHNDNTATKDISFKTWPK
jgi:hypothetical protein